MSVCHPVQVTADERLAAALLRAPLLVTLLSQRTARKGAADPGQLQVPLGTAEVDLSALLQPRCAEPALGRKTAS